MLVQFLPSHTGISWTLYCLAKYPFHQEKCREEIQSVLNGRDTFEWWLICDVTKCTMWLLLSRDDLKSLSYTTMCIKEAMRLYPPVPYYFRQLSEDTVIKEHLIPKGNYTMWYNLWQSSIGTIVNIDAHSLHRQPDVWENPQVRGFCYLFRTSGLVNVLVVVKSILQTVIDGVLYNEQHYIKIAYQSLKMS